MARDSEELQLIWCDGCGVEILWSPILLARRDFCCQDCAEGRPCRCGERMELDERRRARGPESTVPELGQA